MKILVFADSHGQTADMIDIVKTEKPDMIIHAGDFMRDAEELRSNFRDIELHAVSGNCDFGTDSDAEDVFSVYGKKFYLTHGHLQRVKKGYTALTIAANEKQANIVIFGHTHVPLYETIGNLTVINPGSITMGGKTYGIIDIDSGSFRYVCKSRGKGGGSGRK